MSLAATGRAHGDSRTAAARAVLELSEALESEAFAGWDPFDALASPPLRTVARTRLARRVAIQTLKRFPVNLRPLLGVPRLAHTKGLALLTSAYARLAQLPGGDAYGPLALSVAARLRDRGIPFGSGEGFGYDFDVETRWGSYRRGEPNAVVTAFAAHAFLDVAELGASWAEERARAALGFACSDLLVETDAGRFFAYYPGSKVPIHNSSLLLASAASRLRDAPEAVLAASRSAVAFAIDAQRPDGTWPYGEGPALGWVDGFHTAYVLESLQRWHARTGDSAALAALRAGLGAYLTGLVDPDWAPRATLTSRYPIDIHAASSGITALSGLASLDERALPAARDMLGWALAHMRRRDGRFAYRRGRFLRNGIPYVRWSDAHMLLALASYLRAEDASC